MDGADDSARFRRHVLYCDEGRHHPGGGAGDREGAGHDAEAADRDPFRAEDLAERQVLLRCFIAPGKTVDAELARIVTDDECVDGCNEQRADRQHGEEGPPTGRNRQGNAEREIHGDGEAVGGEDDAYHRATPTLRKPAEDQLHVADEDAGVEEADHEPEHHELRVALHEHLEHHANTSARKPDQQHVARRHRPADRRPDDHADAVGQRKDALGESRLGGIELEALGDEWQDGREGIPVGGEKDLAEDGERQHGFLPPGYPTAVVLGDGRPSCCQHGHHRFSRFACRRNRRGLRRAAAGS
ncbi:hypothetical protein ACVW0J_007134 [Bradyrhizobium sp. i1.7.7]